MEEEMVNLLTKVATLTCILHEILRKVLDRRVTCKPNPAKALARIARCVQVPSQGIGLGQAFHKGNFSDYSVLHPYAAIICREIFLTTLPQQRMAFATLRVPYLDVPGRERLEQP